MHKRQTRKTERKAPSQIRGHSAIPIGNAIHTIGKRKQRDGHPEQITYMFTHFPYNFQKSERNADSYIGDQDYRQADILPTCSSIEKTQ